MLRSMLDARVGDDVFGDDPSVMELEAYAAALFGKDAGLFCPSGTMANQIAIKCLTNPGDEVICDQTAHVYNYEGGGIAFNSACSVRTIPGIRGRYTLDQLRSCIHPDDVHYPVSRLAVIENTSNKGGGSCWELKDMEEISSFCQGQGLSLHLDGARIFNALIAKGYGAMEIGRLFITVSVCLSKGLGAPVGSLLLGPPDIIIKARRVRKVLGGGMRQAGYLAAAGLYALKNHVERLEEDHHRARKIAEAVRPLPFVEEVIGPETNILIFRLKEHVQEGSFLQFLKQNQILAVGFGPHTIRFVTHLDVEDGMVDRVIDVLMSYRT